MVEEERRKKLNQYSHNIRFNQIVAPFGVGAMMDFTDQTLMVASTDHWRGGTNIRDERLEQLLNVNSFKLPPTVEKSSGVPMVRFPEWYFCPKCKRFKSIKDWEKEFKNSRNNDDFMVIPKCTECNLQLVPTGIITVCENGHISDFPWIKWIHHKSKKSICANPQIKLKNSTSTLGLEGLKFECVTCGAKASMKGAFNKNVFENMGEEYRCTGNRPWEGKKEKCLLYPKTTQRGGLNVYFPKVVSSLVIPPYSDDIMNEINESDNFNTLKNNLLNEKLVNCYGKENLIEDAIKDIAKEIKRSEEIIKVLLNKKLEKKKSNEENLTKESYRQEEYNALLGNIPKESMDSRDFKLENQNIEEYNMEELSKVTLVKRLREVRALIGFTRLNPPENSVFIENNSDEQNNLVSIKYEEVDWYPAQETRGEGIFIEFDSKKIDNWINSNPIVKDRAKLLEGRYNKKGKQNPRKITPKFILLHTIAHLLIKELSFECGYNSASLSERIFCNTESTSEEMSGILIYTASGDTEGTLGGLIRQGRKDMLPKIFRNAIRRARWCSSDPVCIESKSQGRNGLNLSACHSCTLIAETSCEEFNVLLDRVFIVGTLDKEIRGFFDKFL